MAENIKLIRGEKVQQPGVISRLRTAAARGITQPIESATNILDYLISPLRSSVLGLLPDQQQQMAQKKIEQFQQRPGIVPESLEPQSFPEASAQRFLENAPIAALFGPKVLARSAIGAIPAGFLQYLGAGKGSQDIAQFGTELALGLTPSAKAPGFLKSLAGEVPSIRTAQQAAQTALETTKTKSFAYNQLKTGLQKVSEALSTEVREPITKKINKALEVIQSHIVDKKINPQTAVKLRHNLYTLGKDLSGEDAVRYVQPLTQGINNFFAEYAAENPEFYKHLNVRDRLTELKNMRTLVDKIVDLIPAKSIGNLARGFLDSVLGTTAGKTERALRGIASNPIAREYYFNAVKAAAKNDPTLLITNLEKMASSLPKTEKEEKLKIIRGSRLNQ